MIKITKLVNFRRVAFTALVAISIFGCEPEDPTIVQVPVERPAQDIPSAPSTPPPAQSPGTTPAPVPRTNVPGRLSMLKWAPLDFKTFEYGPWGQLVRYTTQYNSVQGTDIVTKDAFTYSYNQHNQLASVMSDNGFRTDYSYSGAVWKEAISYDKLNRPLKRYEFTFAGQQLIGYRSFKIDLSGVATPESRVDLTYDQKGNLTKWKEGYYDAATNTFTTSIELLFSNFDDKKHPHNANTFGFLLSPLKFWENNPGRKEFLGSSSPVELYTYQYNTDGYPTKKTTSYIYEKPLPELALEYQY